MSRLQLVRRQHHDDVGPLGAVGRAHHREARALGLLDRGRAGLERNAHVLHARIAQIHRMGMALAAVTHDQDLLALDQVHIGIAIVIDTHWGLSSWQCAAFAQTGLTRQPDPQRPASNSMSPIRLVSILYRLTMSPSFFVRPPDRWCPRGLLQSRSGGAGRTAVPMPQVQAAIDNSTPEAAQRGMSNKTWLWTPAAARLRSTTRRRTAGISPGWSAKAGSSRANGGSTRPPTRSGQPITQICLRYPGVRRARVSADLELPARPAHSSTKWPSARAATRCASTAARQAHVRAGAGRRPTSPRSRFALPRLSV